MRADSGTTEWQIVPESRVQAMTTAHTTSDQTTARPRTAGHGVNIWLTSATLALCLFQLFLLPLWLLPHDGAWGWTLASLVLLTTPYWSLIHEAIHGTMFTDRRWNDRCGRVLGVLYGSPFPLLKAGHLLHHRYSHTRRIS
jgi:fatty acid desaturase